MQQPIDTVTMDKIVSLSKRRGFVFPSSEIYGGLGSSYDYGHYGVLLKDNVKAGWLEAMVRERDDIVALDSSIILHPRVWEASGHVGGFTDPLVDCRFCKKRFRAVEETGTDVFLRPETAQGIFINFKNVAQLARRRPPFGIAQVGKSFRNEITPGNFIFRTLEFEQMEMEFFVPPDEAQQWYEYWCQERLDWYTRLGIRRENLRLRPHTEEELSHYSSGTSDVEYLYAGTWRELEGVANRGDFDLTQHAQFSREKLEYKDPQTGKGYIPHVIEPAAGLGRTVLALLCEAYDTDEIGGEKRTVLRLHPSVAPVKVAVLPLLRKDGHPEKAREIYEDLRRRMSAEYDDGGHIGKRYRRQDEIGTPYGVTIDHQTLEDDTVTLRDRDSLSQERVPVATLGDVLVARVTN